MLTEKNINELNEKLYNIKWNDRHKLIRSISEYSEMLDSDEKELVTLFYNILGVSFNPENEDGPYSSFIIMDNKRSFNLKDLKEEDYNSIDYFLSIFESLIVKAILNDVMWLSGKGHEYAENAIDSYILLSDEYFSLDKWPQPIKFIKRAQNISMQLGHKNKRYKDVKEYIVNKIISTNGEDKLFYSISLLEMVVKYKNLDLSLFAISIKNLLEDAKKSKNELRLERIIEINDKYLKSIKASEEELLANKIELAKYYENMGIKFNNNKNYMQSVYYYEKAAFLYKKLKNHEAENRILHLLPELKLELANSLNSFSASQDISEEITKLLESFGEYSLEQAI